MTASMDLNKPEIRFSGSQDFAGFVADAVPEAGSSLVPVIGENGDQLSEADASRLMITLQAAIALLIAHEVSKKNNEYRLKPEKLLYKYFPKFAGEIVSSDGRNIRISGAAMMAYLRYQAMQQLAKSA